MLLFHTINDTPTELRQIVRSEGLPLGEFTTTVAGPSGERGHYWYVDLPDDPVSLPRTVYDPSTQTWRRVGQMQLWIGWNNDQPPTPETLARSEQFEGPKAMLADGHWWQIPNGMRLPYTFDRDENGEVIKRRQAKIQDIYERTVWAFGECRELASVDVPITEKNAGPLGDYCGWLLSLNYRITPAMVWALDLLDQETIWNTMVASTDIQAINRLIDSLSGQSGNQGATEDGQPVPFDGGLTSAAGGGA